MRPFLTLLCVLLFPLSARSQTVPENEVIPLPGHQVSLQSNGYEKTRWHYGPEYPRPFFFPFSGPSGANLTRIGHPGAPNHDHHRSVWFAHHKVNGHNFWADTEGTQIRQKQWLAYQDGAKEAVMATLAGWYAKDDVEQMEQETITALIPLPNDEYALEFQITFRAPESKTKVELEKTNFGFLAVRVAKTISEHFGNGTLTNSEGAITEQQIFAKPAKWMDYSGPVSTGVGENRKEVEAGITFFDHPDNPRYPTHWHVRRDGWMGASFCMNEGWTITESSPLVLRYLLHSHNGRYDQKSAAEVAKAFSERPGFQLQHRPEPHLTWGVNRIQ